MTQIRAIEVELTDDQVHDITLKYLVQTYQIHYDFENDLEDPEVDRALRRTLEYFTTPKQYKDIIKQVESTRKKK